jgi:hypothetical protein
MIFNHPMFEGPFAPLLLARAGVAAPNLMMGPTMMSEGVSFWARRLHAYASLMERVAHSASPADVIAAQMDFATGAQEDYFAEGGALAAIAANTPATSAETAKAHHKRAA